MIRFRIKFLTVGFLIFVLSGCTPLRDVMIHTLEGKNADFSNYKTYFVLPEPPIGDGANTVVRSFPRQTIETAIRRELDAKNYKETSVKENADLFLAIQFTIKDDQRVVTDINYDDNYNYRSRSTSFYGRRYGGYRYGYGYRNYYGYNTRATTSMRIENFRKGNLIIDFIDAKNNELVWEAFANGDAEVEYERIEAKINGVIAEIFSKYTHTAR